MVKFRGARAGKTGERNALDSEISIRHIDTPIIRMSVRRSGIRAGFPDRDPTDRDLVWVRNTTPLALYELRASYNEEP